MNPERAKELAAEWSEHWRSSPIKTLREWVATTLQSLHESPPAPPVIVTDEERKAAEFVQSRHNAKHDAVTHDVILSMCVLRIVHGHAAKLTDWQEKQVMEAEGWLYEFQNHNRLAITRSLVEIIRQFFPKPTPAAQRTSAEIAENIAGLEEDWDGGRKNLREFSGRMASLRAERRAAKAREAEGGK